MSAVGLQRAMGLGSYHAAWEWLHRLRRVMVVPGRNRLTGEVEVDEANVGGVRRGKRGRGADNKSLVLIAVEVRGSRMGRIRLQVIRDATKDVLLPAVQALIAPGSEVVTDGHTGYTELPKHGYQHTISRPTAHLGEHPLPKAHRVVSLFKRWLLGTHQGSVSHELLQHYLDEFVFRFNRRTSRSRGLLFHRLLEQAVTNAPIDLRAKS